MMAVIFVDQPVHVHTTLVNTAINVMEALVRNVQTNTHIVVIVNAVDVRLTTSIV